MAKKATKASNDDGSAKVVEVLDTISGFTLMELAELVKAFEEKFGVQAAGMMVPLGAGGAQAAAEAPVEGVGAESSGEAREGSGEQGEGGGAGEGGDHAEGGEGGLRRR